MVFIVNLLALLIFLIDFNKPQYALRNICSAPLR